MEDIPTRTEYQRKTTKSVRGRQGIGIITNKKNSSVLKLDIPINKIKFKDYYYNYKEYMRVINLNEFGLV